MSPVKIETLLFYWFTTNCSFIGSNVTREDWDPTLLLIQNIMHTLRW